MPEPLTVGTLTIMSKVLQDYITSKRVYITAPPLR
jgi:hypothetical protein